MTLTQIRQMAKGMYGLTKTSTEDPLFTDSVLTDMVNAAHHWFTCIARPYYKTFTTNLPLGTTGATGPGFSTITLDTTVLEVDTGTVRVATNAGLTTWVGQALKVEGEIRQAATGKASENVALGTTPTHFFLRPGSADNAGRALELYPGATPAVTSGVKYNAWIYAADMTADADVPELQPAEHYRLGAATCRLMALLEISRGRADGAVFQLWDRVARDEAIDLREILWRGHQGIPRTAEVGLSSGDDAAMRRAFAMAQARGVG